MSAQVTEAHLELAKTVIFSRDSAGRLLTAPMGAQLIADSEAKACAELRAEVADQVARFHEEIARRQQVVQDNKALDLQERDQLRTERNNLRADLDAIKAIRDEETARAERAEAEVEEQCLLNGKGAEREASLLGQLERSAREIEQKRNLLTVAIKSAGDQATRAERAEAELAGIRALANRRNKRDHVEDTTHQLVAALDQALDIAQAELADEAIALRDMMSERDAAEAALTKERERLDWLAESWDNPLAINLHPSYGWSAASKNIRAAIDGAIKEGSA